MTEIYHNILIKFLTTIIKVREATKLLTPWRTEAYCNLGIWAGILLLDVDHPKR